MRVECDLQHILDGKLLQLKGIIGIYPANSVGDDIEVYFDEDRQRVQCRFFGLRQQAEKENEKEPHLCISDFIAPKASGVNDYLGLFANATFGVEDMVQKYKADVSCCVWCGCESSADVVKRGTSPKSSRAISRHGVAAG